MKGEKERERGEERNKGEIGEKKCQLGAGKKGSGSKCVLAAARHTNMAMEYFHAYEYFYAQHFITFHLMFE